MRSPLLALAICFALGIVMARSGPPPFLKDFRLMGILLAAAGACMLFALIAMRGVWLRASWLLTLLGFVFAGTLAAALFESRFAPNHVSHLADLGVDVSRPVRLQGVIVSIPYPTPFGLQFDVEAQNVESRGQTHFTAGKVRLRLETSDDPEMLSARDSLRLQSGDSIRALAQLHRPRSYQNPGSFDLRQWMESIEDLYWVGNIKSPLLIEKLPSASPPVVTGLLDGVRRRALQSIDGLYPPWSRDGRDGAVLKAMLLGDRTSLDSDTIEAFRKTGLYHLLVIAGLHVGLLAGLAAALLRRFRVRETWRAAALLALLFAYAAVVEQRAPTLRATLMICVYLLARWLYRQHAALNAIGLAALVLLLRRPAWLFETGFELSFCAALLIAGLAVPVLLRTTEPYRRGLRRLEEINLDPSLPPRVAQFRLDVRALIFSLKTRSRFLERHPAIAAVFVMSPARLVPWAVNAMLFAGILQLGLLLPMAEDFHRVSFAGIGLNALAIPVMTLVLGIGMPTLVLGAIFPALAAWPAKGLGFLLSWLFALTDWPGLPHWLSFRVANPPPWVAWGFVLSVVLAAWALGRHARVFRTSAATTVVFAALISLHPFAPPHPQRRFGSDSARLRRWRRLFFGVPGQNHNARGRGKQPHTFHPRRSVPGTTLGPRRRHCFALFVGAWNRKDRLPRAQPSARGPYRRAGGRGPEFQHRRILARRSSTHSLLSGPSRRNKPASHPHAGIGCR